MLDLYIGIGNFILYELCDKVNKKRRSGPCELHASADEYGKYHTKQF